MLLSLEMIKHLDQIWLRSQLKFTTRSFSMILVEANTVSLSCPKYNGFFPNANKFPHDWTQMIISHVISMGSQPHHLLKPFSRPVVANNWLCASLIHIQWNQWATAWGFHNGKGSGSDSHAAKQAERERAGEERWEGGVREGERNSGPNSFSAWWVSCRECAFTR